MDSPSLVNRRRAGVGALAVAGLMLGAQFVSAQAALPQGVDQTPARVLEIKRVLGVASVQRSGRTEPLQPGFLVFNRERVLLSSRSRAALALSRYGQIDFASSGNGTGVLILEKLPSSSWAEDLETRLKLERGLLRVDLTRTEAEEDWPLAIVIDRWSAQLGSGEFLFRNDERGILICNIAGSLELSDESADRQPIKRGACTQMLPDQGAQAAPLAASDWAELQLAILPAEEEGAVADSRSLPAVPSPPPEAAERAPVVAPSLPDAGAEVVVQTPSVSTGSVAVEITEVVPEERAVTAVQKPAVVVVAPVVSTPPDASALAPAVQAATPPEVAASSPSAGTTVGGTPASPTVAATAGAPTESVGPEWIVNVMTVTDPELARQHQAALVEAGYPATLRTEVVRGRSSYRIIIAGIGSEQGARRTAQLLASKMGYTAAWPLQKR